MIFPRELYKACAIFCVVVSVSALPAGIFLRKLFFQEPRSCLCSSGIYWGIFFFCYLGCFLT